MRTHYCGKIDASLVDADVTLCGWVDSRRDHGGVIFIDLRDREGIVQVTFDPQHVAAFKLAEQIRHEYVLQITGKVRPRPKDTENPQLPTGMVEVEGVHVTVLNKADVLPFQLDEAELGESVRLKHRYIDLRRRFMQKNIRLRHEVVRNLRRFLEDKSFTEIETPILTRSTPEGARDYLVPSRTHQGHFFALPQSPQLFKQLLMVSGFERYYQITRCFRDEDLRADRQPEFTQLDVELSFVDESAIMTLMEEMIRCLFKTVLDVDLPNPFPRIDYDDAVRRFGIDRPDLRNPLELTELADIMAEVEFKVFSAPARDPQGRVAALRVPKGGELTRKQIDDYTAFVARFGAKGLAYIKINDRDAGAAGLQSPILKFLPDKVVKEILKRTQAQNGDLIFFGADKATVVNDALSALRGLLAKDLGLLKDGWRPVWVVNFPMFQYEAGAKSWQSVHHPFTAPQGVDEDTTDEQVRTAKARAYDMVLNGMEIGGGSIRIHRAELQQRVLEILGFSAESAKAQFGFLLDALRYGAPPHGGIAFGIDRIAALMAGVESIRDVIPFPKTQKASCLLTEAPSVVDEKQLRELNIRLRKQVEGIAHE